jgi:hypothetical protein
MIDYDRIKFNRLNKNEQEMYIEKLKNKKYYWVDDRQVPKLIYDVVEG